MRCRRRILTLGLSTLPILGACGSLPKDSQAHARYSLPPRLTALTDAGFDPELSLPRRARHDASGIVMVLILPGEFQMGEDDTASRRTRRITKPFYMTRTEVTVAQFRRFADATGYRTDAERGVPESDSGVTGAFSELPDGHGYRRAWHAAANWQNLFPNFADRLGDTRFSPDWPVVQVSWNDATRFAEHFGLKLPTEAQWEYAARAGTTTRFPWGDATAVAGRANVADATLRRELDVHEGLFPFDDGVALLSPVGRYAPNAWGLYDMIGNVEEWCIDEYRAQIPTDRHDESAVEAHGPGDHSHIVRGGWFVSGPLGCGSGTRHSILAEARREWIGFRVVASLP